MMDDDDLRKIAERELRKNALTLSRGVSKGALAVLERKYCERLSVEDAEGNFAPGIGMLEIGYHEGCKAVVTFIRSMKQLAREDQ